MHFLFLQIPPDLCCEVKDRFTVTKDWHQPCAKYDAQATDLSFNSVSGLQKHSMKNSKETELITKTRLSSLINTRNTWYFACFFTLLTRKISLGAYQSFNDAKTSNLWCLKWHMENWNQLTAILLQDTMFHTSNILYQKCKNSKHCPLVEIDTELRNQFFLTP